MDPKTLLTILHQAEKLKCVTRHCDTSSGRRESVAEHSWRLALMAMLVSGEFPNLQMDKVIRNGAQGMVSGMILFLICQALVLASGILWIHITENSGWIKNEAPKKPQD